MLDGFGKAEIQAKLNISQPTLYRWQQLPAWQLAVEEVVKTDTKTGEVQLKTLLPLATQAVHKLLLTGTDQIKLGASRLVYETVAHMLQREEQQEMLALLEEQVAELRDAARQQQQQQQLPQAVIDVIDAPDLAHSHDSSHNESVESPEA